MNNPPSNVPMIDDYKAAFDAHLEAVAQERQYDNRLTIATYVASATLYGLPRRTPFVV